MAREGNPSSSGDGDRLSVETQRANLFIYRYQGLWRIWVPDGVTYQLQVLPLSMSVEEATREAIRRTREATA